MGFALTNSCFYSFRNLPIWALGGSNIGRKTRGRLTKILPARQTIFFEVLWPALRGKLISGKCTQNKIGP